MKPPQVEETYQLLLYPISYGVLVFYLKILYGQTLKFKQVTKSLKRYLDC